MRVLIVTNMYPDAARSFRGVFVKRQVDSLRAAGLVVEVEVIADVRGRVDYLTGRARVARHVRAFGPDVVHVHFGYSAFAGLLHGLPSVVTLHGSDLWRGAGTGVRGRAGSMFTRVLAQAADRIIVQNEAMKADLRPGLQTRTVVMPNGVDDAMFRPLPASVARARLQLPSGQLVVLFVDTGNPRCKRPDLAAKAVECVTAAGRPCRLLVASGVSAPEMPWYYAAADALLVTSDYEGSPMSVKEALACGTPVVSVPVGDVEQVVDVPERGMIAPRDPVKLAEAILAVMSRPRSDTSLLPPSLRSGVIAQRLIDLYTGLLTPQGHRLAR